MGDGDQLVGLLLQGLLHLLQRVAVANGCAQLCHLGAVCLQALAEGITKVTSVKNQSILASLDQVGGDKVPTEGTTTGDKEGLCGGVGGLEQLAGHGQGLTEDLDEAGSDMALTVCV